MKRISFILIIALFWGGPLAQSAQAAKDCSALSDAVTAAEATVAGMMATSSAANAALSAAKSKLNSARLPAQRVSAQVSVMRAEKDVNKWRNALTVAKSGLRSARLSLKDCK